MDIHDRLVASPCCLPAMPLQPLLAEYRALGFRHFEVFTTWVAARFDPANDAADYLSIAREYGFDFTSVHLPPITDEPQSFGAAVDAAAFAAALGADTVLFKAKSRELYIEQAGPFLDAVEARGLKLTTVAQNHAGSPITTIDDYAEVLAGVDDPRLLIVLEIGHFARAKQDWRLAAKRWPDRIGLVHVNQINADGKSVPYDQGVIDWHEVMATLKRIGCDRRIVVELEREDRNDNPQPTLQGLAQAVELLTDAAREA